MDRNEEIHPRGTPCAHCQVIGHSIVPDQNSSVASVPEARVDFPGKLKVILEFRNASGADDAGFLEVVPDVNGDAGGKRRRRERQNQKTPN
jgi:hypothetical protein